MATMESYNPHAWQIVHRPKKKRPIKLSEKVQEAAESRGKIVAKTKSIITKLSTFTLRKRTNKPAQFRFEDLPDELQLYILRFAIPPRTCHIMEGKIENRYQSYKRRNPHYLAVKCRQIPLSLVCRKWQSMVNELRPKCFTINEYCSSTRLHLRFNLEIDTLVIPQWLLEAPGVTITNLSKVKSMIIAYTKRPSPKTLAHISTLSPSAIVAYIHAGLTEHYSLRTSPRLPFPFPRPRLAHVSPFGPFPHKDIEYRHMTQQKLDALSAETGKRYARVVLLRVSSGKRANSEQEGFFYWLGKGIAGVWIREGFRRKEKKLDGDLRLMRELALLCLRDDMELPSWASSGLKKIHDRHLGLMLHDRDLMAQVAAMSS